MNRNILIIIIVVAVVLIGGGLLYANKQANKQHEREQQQAAMQAQEKKQKQKQEAMNASATVTAAVMKSEKTIPLAEENNSGQSGTANLKEVNGKVVVTVALNGEPKDASEPAHIHQGVCPGIGKVVYPLTNIINGTSTTTLEISMEKLMQQLPLAINTHQSAQKMNVYTSCGNLGSTASPSASPTK